MKTGSSARRPDPDSTWSNASGRARGRRFCCSAPFCALDPVSSPALYSARMAVTRAESIWMNGRLVAWDQATVHILAHVIHYVSCIFDGMRCYRTQRGPAIFRLREHVDRLFDGCKIYRIEIPYTRE